MNIGDLFFKAQLDDSRLALDARKAGEKAGTAAGTGLKSKLSGFAKQGFGMGVGLGAFNLVGQAISKVTDLVGDATSAFIEDEHSQASLRTSLRANIPALADNADALARTTDAIEATIKARMSLGFSDDEQRESLKGLVAAYGDVSKALEVQRTAMDLARFSGTDLASASDTLIKVHAGNYRALKSLGIQTEDVTDETAALAAVQKVAAGQAEDYTQTLEGRLTVAATKNKEAMEALGQSTAELQADVGDLAAGSIEKFATGLDFLADSLNINNQTLERQIELHEQSIAMSGQNADATEIATLAELKAKKAAIDHADALQTVSHEVRDEADAARHSKGPTNDLANAFANATREAKDLDDAIDGLTSSIEDGLFGDAINAGNEAQLKENIRDLQKQRDEVKKNTPKWLELTGEIAENKQKLFDLQLQMKEKEGPLAVIAWLKRQKTLYHDDAAAIQRLIDKYRLLRTVMVVGGQTLNVPTSDPAHRASGGPVAAGTAYTVGENGPETFVAPANGMIIPNPELARMSYAGVPSASTSWSSNIGPITLNVDARGASNPAAIGNSVKQGVHDAIADVLRQQSARLPSGTRS